MPDELTPLSDAEMDAVNGSIESARLEVLGVGLFRRALLRIAAEKERADRAEARLTAYRDVTGSTEASEDATIAALRERDDARQSMLVSEHARETAVRERDYLVKQMARIGTGDLGAWRCSCPAGDIAQECLSWHSNRRRDELVRVTEPPAADRHS